MRKDFRFKCIMQVSVFCFMAYQIAIAHAQIQVNQGPVASNCKSEIEKFCLDKSHYRGEVRKCLESHVKDLSNQCRNALQSTGKGKRRNPYGSG